MRADRLHLNDSSPRPRCVVAWNRRLVRWASLCARERDRGERETRLCESETASLCEEKARACGRLGRRESGPARPPRAGLCSSRTRTCAPSSCTRALNTRLSTDPAQPAPPRRRAQRPQAEPPARRSHRQSPNLARPTPAQGPRPAPPDAHQGHDHLETRPRSAPSPSLSRAPPPPELASRPHAFSGSRRSRGGARSLSGGSGGLSEGSRRALERRRAARSEVGRGRRLTSGTGGASGSRRARVAGGALEGRAAVLLSVAGWTSGAEHWRGGARCRGLGGVGC